MEKSSKNMEILCGNIEKLSANMEKLSANMENLTASMEKRYSDELVSLKGTQVLDPFIVEPVLLPETETLFSDLISDVVTHSDKLFFMCIVAPLAWFCRVQFNYYFKYPLLGKKRRAG